VRAITLKEIMNKVVGIRFRNSGKVYDFDPGPFVLKKDDKVMVITDEGPAIGSVCTEPQAIGNEIPDRELKKIFRLATQEEIERFERSCARENDVYDYCCKKIAERGLPMSLVSVERRFDGSKIIVYFTAAGRVDFRALVKDLVQQFRTRIEMRQIGVRQQAKIVGGLGPCGRPLCCATFLDNFTPVTIKMAKGQNISLNPSKISGMCGRLMCCLAYEHKHYEKIKKDLPKTGKKVTTKEGEGKVIRQNVLKETLTVLLESGGEIEVKVQDIVRDKFFKKTPKKGRREKDPRQHDKQKKK
jgi:cell fate regulator YaaT (PSP1 superfamily)